METKEWRTVDKARWPLGPWNDEPDKMQWTDEATGLPCLIVRGPFGALCGYVGVAPTHPWFGKSYHEAIDKEACPHKDDDYCDCTRVESKLEVHGGITFASSCMPHDRASWEKLRASRPGLASEAAKFPNGDSARYLRRFADVFEDLEAYQRMMAATAICHVGDESDQRWWFGFDCSHAWDIAPGMDRLSHVHEASYKSISYVQCECVKLAKQLQQAAA